MIKTVAIQGVKGSFHDLVANEYFGNQIIVKPSDTFDGCVDYLINNEVDAVVMALENSIAGSIIPNYALIHNHNLQIVGEHYLNVQHHLMCLKNQDISDIKEVQSHPMALLQCKTFFKKHPHIKLVEAKDTAIVAEEIAKKQLNGVAAIASQRASDLYDLKILKESIQTINHNETRFIIAQQKSDFQIPQNINKTSLRFELSHKRGSLATILNVLSDCKLNLTKIQSLPKIDTPWKYGFFVDVTFDDYEDFKKAKSIVSLMAENFEILGEYKNAKS